MTSFLYVCEDISLRSYVILRSREVISIPDGIGGNLPSLSSKISIIDLIASKYVSAVLRNPNLFHSSSETDNLISSHRIFQLDIALLKGATRALIFVPGRAARGFENVDSQTCVYKTVPC